MKRWNIWIEDDLLAQIKKRARFDGVSAAEWLREAGIQRLQRLHVRPVEQNPPQVAAAEVQNG